MLVFPCHRSLAGLVWNKGSPFITNSIDDEFKFVPEIDDPSGTKEAPPRNLLSVPIYLRENLQAEIGAYPNCIINFINKD